MDYSMLGNQSEPTSIDLSGLSPEEIQGVSRGRLGREQMMGQAIDRLMGFQKMKSTIAGQEEARKSSIAARSLSEEKLRQSKEGDEDMTITGPDDKPYQIKRRDLTESLKFIDQAKLRARQGKLADAQLEKLQERIPMNIQDASGKEKIYPVSPALFPAISEAIQDRKTNERKEAAIKDCQGKSAEELMKKENFSTFFTAFPTGAAAALNKYIPEGVTGLSDSLYRHYADFTSKLTNNILKMPNPDEALIQTTNGTLEKMQSSYMLLRVPGSWGRTKAVTVPLPPNWTADKVSRIAALKGINVSEVLQQFYNKLQESENE